MRFPHRAEVLSSLFTLFATLLAPLFTFAVENQGPGTLPWNKPLDVLKANLTGPTATVLILIALTFAFILWSFSDNNHGLMKAFKALIALAVIATAGGFLSSLGIGGATL